MNKLSRILGVLDERDLLEGAHVSRAQESSSYALDIESILNPNDEQKALIAKWYQDLDDLFSSTRDEPLLGWGREHSDGTNGVSLAWYQPLTYYREYAGIYLTDYGIWWYASAIRNGIGLGLFEDLEPSPEDHICVSIAVEMLLLHETFHHDVEWFSIKLNSIHNSPRLYSAYDRQVYKNSEPLEEALATANMQLGLSSRENVSKFNSTLINQARAILQLDLATAARGYRDAQIYSSKSSFNFGRRLLSASINQLDPNPRTYPGGFSISMGKGLLSDYFRNDFTVVQIAKGSEIAPPPGSLSFAIKAKGVESLLCAYGYFRTDLGKGSHTVWKHQTLRPVTLPNRRDLEGYQVLKNVRDALNFESLEELRSAIEKP